MFHNKRRIILAKIEIPVEFFPDGSHINHNDRACVNFYRCPLLPPQQNYDDVDFGEIIENLLSSPEGVFQDLADDENPIFIMKEPDIHLDVEETDVHEDVVEETDVHEDLVEETDVHEDLVEDPEQELEDDKQEEYYVLTSELPAQPRPPSKNTSFKRNPSRGKRGITYKKYG
jgi:hypothetical protein